MNTTIFPRGMGYAAHLFRALQPKHDPRHIEAYVRVEYGTLSALSVLQLRDEAALAADCIDVGGIDAAETLARSFGL